MSSEQGNISPIARAKDPIDQGVRVGHVHLRTSDIDRVRAFYVDILGFDVVSEARDVPGWGTTGDLLFISAGGYHHHLGFNTWKSTGGPPQPDGVAGLHHVALAYPTRRALADAYRRLKDANWPIRQTADHGTHEAIYVSDPDGNDVELMWDRSPDLWPLDDHGHLAGQFGSRARPRRAADRVALAIPTDPPQRLLSSRANGRIGKRIGERRFAFTAGLGAGLLAAAVVADFMFRALWNKHGY